MIPTLIGVGSGILIILLFRIFSQFDKALIYSLILTGIGFIYVGFTWTDLTALVICSIQAVIFLMLAYFGFKRSLFLLAAGYFLHGTWDIGFSLINDDGLIPPQYDIFCLSIDFTMGLYLLWFAKTKRLGK